MRFFSDNAARVHPALWAAMAKADALDTAYDGDAHSARLDGAFSDLFGTPVRALWVPTGTAANCLALAALCPPYRGIIAHEEAHIVVDEAGAPGFYTGGASVLSVAGTGAKLTPEAIQARLAGIRPDVHQVQASCITITNATEYGLVYAPEDVAALGALARERGLKLHMDGARFANAVAHLGCHPGDLTWRAGVDALSFGCVKNGGMNAEAIICFDTALADEIAVRRKRAGHLQSKGRYLAAQLLAMLDDDLWLDNARAANASAQIIASAAEERLLFAVQANEVFLSLSRAEAAQLRSQGFDFYDWPDPQTGAPDGAARLVTAWDSDAGDVTALAAALAAL